MAAALAELQPAVQPTVFSVHPDNIPAVRLFQGMATQWNTVSAPAFDRVPFYRIGLKYEVLDRVARGLGLQEGEGDFARLQAMEAVALVAWAERRS